MLDFGFYNMDCLSEMKKLPDKSIDVCICDPPYGIDITKFNMGVGGGIAPHKNRYQNWGYCTSPKTYNTFNDTAPPKEYFDEIERVSKHRIIWGGNYFLDYLGRTSCMIVWDKGRRGLNFADCEIAWTDFEEPCRIFEFLWNGMLQGDMKNKEYRIHATQKPVKLYEWLLSHYSKEGDIILDTHVGSASSLIACHNLNRKYIGFEIDKNIYNLAKKRLDAETAQMNLWEYL